MGDSNSVDVGIVQATHESILEAAGCDIERLSAAKFSWPDL